MFYLRPALLVLLILFTLVATLPAAAQPAAEPRYRLYMPVVSTAPQTTIFGVETRSLAPGRGLDMLSGTNTSWVRRNSLRWAEIEPVRGQGYNWNTPKIRQLEQEMIDANVRGINFIVVVNGSPRWAVEPYRADCAPINPLYYEDFARFMSALVERYSQPPYNMRYWEIGNEPDANIFPSNSGFGCWGVKTDPYYGGEAFGQMLRAVAPAIRQANPNAKILNGGLLLPRPYDPNDPTSLLGRFFEGMLRAGAGEAFDIVSFHHYEHYYHTPGSDAPVGSRDDWRVTYLADLLERYNVPPKPFIRTESGLLCPVLSPECRWAQADYVARLYTRTLRDGLLANLWYVYDSDSFHNTAMIDIDEANQLATPRPTYFAYRHVAQLLSEARYLGPISTLPPQAEGYVFSTRAGTVFVFWADLTPVAFSLPIQGRSVSCSDRDGGYLPCTVVNRRLNLTATLSPGFVVVSE